METPEEKETLESITKDKIIIEIETYIIKEYIAAHKGEAVLIIKPNEFLKAQEMIIKLKGFDKVESGQDLPDELELLIP